MVILATWSGSDAVYGQSHPWTWHFIFKDSVYYLGIAEHGYPGRLPSPWNGSPIAARAAFFPVFPLLIRFISYLTGGDYLVAGLMASVLAGAASALGVLGALAAAHRHDLRGMFRGRARHWAGGLAVAALLLVPIALDTILHWPGQFGHYLTYRRKVAATHAIHHTLGVCVRYMLRYWWPGIPASTAAQGGLWVAAVLAVVALALALRCPRPGLRRFLLWSLAMAALITVLFVCFARTSMTDKDITHQAYLGYFYWAAPLVVALVAVAGASVYLDGRRTVWLALAAVVAGGAVIATVAPQQRDNPDDPPAHYLGVPQIPQVVAAMAAVAAGRPMLVSIDQNDWMDRLAWSPTRTGPGCGPA